MGSGENGWRGGQGDECSSPDKGVCIPRQRRECGEGDGLWSKRSAEEAGQLSDYHNDFSMIVIHA